MASGMHFAQGLNVDVGVNLRRFHAHVAQHFLYIPNVRPAPVHVGGATVAPQMAGAAFVDAAMLQELFDPVTEVGGGDAGAVSAEEERGFAGQVGEKRAGLGQKAVEPRGGARAHGEHPAILVLALAHGERLLWGYEKSI